MATGSARKLVVVLDDDPGVLKAVQRLLTAVGFDCEMFRSVQDFEIGARLDSALCLVLDINLNGESGIDVRRKLAARSPLIPVIFITGNDSEGTRNGSRLYRLSRKAIFGRDLCGRCRESGVVDALNLAHQP